MLLYGGSIARLSRKVVFASMDVFHSEGDRRECIGMLGEKIERHGVSILVWRLMSNHVHFAAVPHQETLLARAFGSAPRRYTRMKTDPARVHGYRSQGRFASCALDESHLMAAARYVEMNRVRPAWLPLHGSTPG